MKGGHAVRTGVFGGDFLPAAALIGGFHNAVGGQRQDVVV